MFQIKKSFLVLVVSLSLLFSVFAQSSTEDEAVLIEVSDLNITQWYTPLSEDPQEQLPEENQELDDFDSLFDNATDYEEPIITEDKNASTDYNVQLGSIKFPIEVSGKMSAEVGGAFTRESMANDVNIYFDFKNYIYFTTRPDKYIALKGVLKTCMPNDDDDSESNQFLYLYEMYFEYLFINRAYFTAGKKKSIWGNIRLFSNGDDYNDNYALYTNLLYDSRDQISGIIKIPFGKHTFTMLAMYNVNDSSGNSPGTKDMSLALSAEFIVFNTSLNFFGRRFPEVYGTNAEDHQPTIVGVELKRTILAFDLYGQTMVRANTLESATRELIKSQFEDFSSVESITSTVGFYRIWDNIPPYYGLNFEFQNIYHPELEEGTRYFTNRFALYCGISKLGKKKNIKAGITWNHNIDDKIGVIEPGIVVSRIIPHADWKNGFKFEYGDSTQYSKYRLTIGSYVTISMDY